MVEYASAAGTPLSGAYSAPETPNWTKGENGRKRRGGRRGWERKTRGGWETGTGHRREERKGKRGREGEERGVPPASAPTSTSVCETVSHCKSWVRGCLSFACGENLGWVIPRTSNGVSVDGRTGG